MIGFFLEEAHKKKSDNASLGESLAIFSTLGPFFLGINIISIALRSVLLAIVLAPLMIRGCCYEDIFY